MKEEDNILKKVGKENVFRVPMLDDYSLYVYLTDAGAE